MDQAQDTKDKRTKICGSCGEEKSLDDFYDRRVRGETRKQSRCKSCANGRRWENGRFTNEQARLNAKESNRRSYQRHGESYKMRNAERKLRYKLAAMEVLGGPKCARCPECHPFVLEFHHIDPSSKDFEVTRALFRPGIYSWDVIEAEIRKCELICANCHALEHLSFDYAEFDGEWKVLKANDRGEKFLGQKDGKVHR